MKSGPVAIVTGAAMGIGRAIATRLGSDGYRIGIVDVELAAAQQVVSELERQGVQACAARADVSVSQEVEQAFDEVERSLGTVRYLVNNAGRVLQKMLVDVTDADWRRILGTDLDGVFHGTRALARRRQDGQGGAIVNISSVLADLPRPLNVPYAAAKAAVEGFTRASALELGPQRIRVNAVAPGHIKTPLTERMFTPPVAAAFNARIPLGELGEAQWIADAVAFLLSEAAHYVHGQVLTVDGGYNINGNLPGVEFGPNR